MTDQVSDAEVRNDPALTRLFERMPDSVSQSFTDEQLLHLRNAVAAREWGRHKLDVRGVLTIPLVPWRYYYVILMGRNRRELAGREKQVSHWLTTLFIALFILFSTLFGLLVIYLLKSAAGVDLFPGFGFALRNDGVGLEIDSYPRAPSLAFGNSPCRFAPHNDGVWLRSFAMAGWVWRLLHRFALRNDESN